MFLRWEPGAAAKRIVPEATFASVALGLFLAAFQVLGWTMPKPIGITVIVILGVMSAVAVLALVYEAVRIVRAFIEHRATTASWVSSEKPGLLDYEADGIKANKRFTKELNKLNRGTERLGKRLERHGKRFERLKSASGKKKQKRADRSARALDKSAVFIEKRLDLLQALVKDIVRNTEGLISVLDLETDADLAAAQKFRDTLGEGHESTTGALEGIGGYRVAVKEIEEMNLSRTIRIASHRLGASLDGLEKMLRRHQGGLLRLVQSLDSRIYEFQRHRDQAARR